MASALLLENPSAWPMAMAAALAAGGVSWWLYRPALAGLRGRWRWAPAGLRLATILLLSAALLRPAVMRPRPPAGALVVLVDKSASMATVESARPVARRVAALRALAPRGVPDDGTAAISAALEELGRARVEVIRAEGELRYARLAGADADAASGRRRAAAGAFDMALARVRGMKPPDAVADAVAAIAPAPGEGAGDDWAAESREALERASDAAAAWADASAERLCRDDDAVRAACDKVGAMTRIGLSEWALLAPSRGIVDRLGGATPIHGFSFGRGTTPIPLRGEGDAAPSIAVSADAGQADLGAAMSEVANRLRGAPLEAVIVLSDGRGLDVGAAATLARDAPIHCVEVASSPLDVSVRSMAAPAGAFVGEGIVVRARVSASGVVETPVEVRLSLGDEAPTRRVILRDDRVADVDFHVVPNEPGIRRIAIDVSELPGESSAANNHAEGWIKVFSDKVKVAAITADPGWDHQCLRSALRAAPWIELDDHVVRAPGGCPLTPEQILARDVVILDDVPTDRLTDAQWDAIHQLVVDRGGSAILIAGDDAAPALPETLIVRDLLPFDAPGQATRRVWPGERAGFHAAPGADAAGDAILQITDDPQMSPRRWGELPGFFRYVLLPKPRPGVRSLLVERDSRAPLLTEQRVGAGKAYVLAMRETWRWGMSGDGAVQDRFWVQLIRQAADEPYAAVAGGYALDIDRAAIGPDETVRVRARRMDPAASSAMPGVRVERTDGSSRRAMLSPLGPNRAGRFDTVVGDLAPGLYTVRLTDGAGRNLPGAPTLPLRVTDGADAEIRDLRPDPAALRRLSDATGGRTVALGELPQLLDEIESRRARHPRSLARALWDGPWFFALVGGCLTLEWALRKRWGLS